MPRNTEIAPKSNGNTQASILRSTIEDFFEAVEDTLNGEGVFRSKGFFPRAELSQNDGGLKLSLELPGMTQDDVKVTVQDRTVTVEGEKREEVTQSEGSNSQSERRYGSFYRMFTAPFPIDPESLSAKFEHGVLTLEIPKPANFSGEAREIPIKH